MTTTASIAQQHDRQLGTNQRWCPHTSQQVIGWELSDWDDNDHTYGVLDKSFKGNLPCLQ